MKFRLLVKLGEWILGKGMSEPRADMYLPVKLLAMALVLLVGGVAFAVAAVIWMHLWVGVGAIFALVLGAVALLCWKNQTIVMLLNDCFEYTTFLGNKRIYRFRDIRQLRRNSDSITLFVGAGKVHIESMAILSDRLIQRISQALEENGSALQKI